MIRSLALSLVLIASPLIGCAPVSAQPEPASASMPGMVSAADPRAAAAGQEILRAGGSATDAAMAMMLALTVVEPQSSGIGGGGFFVRHDAATGQPTTIDGRETAPSTATPDLFLNEQGEPLGFRQAVPGGRSVGIPGNIRLMAEVHGRWGQLEWAQLFEPAIRLAEEGYTVNARMARFLGFFAEIWQNFPDAQALYWEDGAPKEDGDTVHNPALAALLRRVASEGPDSFYSGENVEAIQAATSNSPINSLTIPADDFASYRAIERAAICQPYRSYRVCGMGPPSSGATTVLQILGMLERFDMGELGPRSAQSWHLIGEAMRLAYADRSMYLGDMDFVSVPVEGLLDRDYLAQRSALISETSGLGSYEAGTPPGSEARTAGLDGEISGTTHFVAVDSSGNVVTMTSTIEGPFGSQLVANGYFLNNELTDFDFTPERDGAPVANAVAPGKRPLSSMSPTLVYDADGRLVLALGSAGGRRIIMHVAKTLIGVLDWGLPVDEAIALPNIYFGGDGLRIEQDSYLAEIQGEISALSGLVVASRLTSKVNAVQWTENGWVGAADPRSPGVALSE
ncbi:gamma-glutamyltransferase [Parasphingopyxis sp. CP4]|uniref:gamma-glutamyltransferase n=1 Tax=Parasphingopyxis sp. CP4 TaxID=2724527 RepID=UPI0015A256C2|nr:gamma-glutamyltransferase [Parasphingopyxis sp. CP4]QLC22621.1 gamma-glutamyltransferase [Parasphingopyxis sp. CP4]